MRVLFRYRLLVRRFDTVFHGIKENLLTIVMEGSAKAR